MALPDGLIGTLFGPVGKSDIEFFIQMYFALIHSFIYIFKLGRKHDSNMLTDSGLLNDLQRLTFSPGGHPMCVYGNLAYPLRVNLQAPFRNAVMTPLMEAFNHSMSTVRESVEWLFNDIINYFKLWTSKRIYG